MRRPPRFARVLLSVATAAAVLSCAGVPIAPDATISVREFISRVATVDGQYVANYVGEEVPPEPSGGPEVSLTAPPVVILGGSSQIVASSSAPFSQIIIAVPGVPGYWLLDLPSATTEQRLILSYSQDMPVLTFETSASIGTSGVMGPYWSASMRALRVGTGDVQVTVSWDALNDVDLHVIDPNGDKVYFGQTRVPSGGELDLDANAACGIDNPVINNENITWADNTAPQGNYTVIVDLWSACGTPGSNYVVSVHRKGYPLEVFSGSVTPDQRTDTVGVFPY